MIYPSDENEAQREIQRLFAETLDVLKESPISNLDLLASFVVRDFVTHMTSVLSNDPVMAKVALECYFAIDVSYDGGGTVSICPKNIFSLMAIMGVYRDPIMLQAMTQRTDLVGGAWRDVYCDERGTWTVTYDPKAGWGSSFAPEALVDYVVTTIYLNPPLTDLE